MGLKQDSKVEREKETLRQGLGEMMTLSFRLLLDMHKCQSDYNAGSTARRALLLRPARNVFIVLSYGSVHSAPKKKRTVPRHESCEL